MRGIVLNRFYDDGQRTFGVLVCDKTILPTIENPWINNKRNISCIPIGRYRCVVYQSPKFGLTFHILNVPGRGETEAIIFHIGNLDDDTRGCIIIGNEFGELNSEPAVLNSRKGFKRFMETMIDDEFELTVRNTF